MGTKDDQIEKKELYVVGVGTSAGGLDALTKFLINFNGVEADFCVVIVMHLSPDYKSELTAILAKRCKWPVETVQQNMQMKSRHIYVTPQNSDLHIEENLIRLDELPPKYSHAPSIDHFFKSLGKNKKRHSLGVILSGYGQDGAEGVKSIKKHKGFTIAQLPETAEHRDMPKNAIETGRVDMVIPAEQMFDEITQFINNSHTIAQSKPEQKSVDAIFKLLEKRSGTDFSLYKPSTILRRIDHRMSNLQIATLQEYYSMIKNSPKELDILFETVLIGVTEFFRDKKAFDSLKTQLETLLKTKRPGDSIRIWSVGCATGEEPYSLGILLHEILGPSINQFYLQIFASDIDERALNFARKGIYRTESLENLDQKLIDTYFTKRDAFHYELNKEIKQHILFTRHDISNDPPFVKLDLVVCRNLLIYFNNELQKQSLQIFHYSLRPKGIMFLGKSESISAVTDLFDKSDSHKIFQKADSSLTYDLRFSRFKQHRALRDKMDNQIHDRNMSIVDIAKETLYYKYQHPFVIINENAEIKEVHGSLRLYLEISQGTMNANLYKMANKELVTVLKAVHAQVKKTGVQHLSHVIKFNLYGSDHFVQIRITPLIYTVKESLYYLVIFEKIEPSEQVLDLQKRLETSDFVDLRIKELEDELATHKEHLQVFTEELEATNEELQIINEELQSTNEELKSSNEELETSNEELQSANEELNTANYELRITNDALIEKEKELQEEKELSQRNEMIYKTVAQNIPDGALGILNEQLEIEFIAGQGLEEFTADELIGKKLADLNPSPKEAKRIRTLCENTLKGKPGSLQIQYNNHYYSIKTVPFQMPVTGSKKVMYLTQETTADKKNQIMLNTALEASNMIVFEYDFEKDQIMSHKMLARLLEVHPNKKLKEKDLIDRLHPQDVSIWIENFEEAKKTGDLNLEVRLMQTDSIKHIRVTGHVIFDEEKNPLQAFATILDITEDQELLNRVIRSEARFRNIADAAPLVIWATENSMECSYVNKTWLDFTGSTLKENLGFGFYSFVHPDDIKSLKSRFKVVFDKKDPFTIEYRVRSKEGAYKWFLNSGVPIFDDQKRFKGYVGSSADIHDKKKFTEKLEREVKSRTAELKNSNEELVKANINLEEYAYVASHDLQEPLRKIRTFNSMLQELQAEEGSIDKYSEKIEDLAERMTELIKGILTYGELSKDSNQMDAVDLDQLMKNVKSDLGVLLKEKNAVLKADKLGVINGDTIYIYQLFVNLIRNGIKFNNH
ncbi:MAG: PAS domain-containing protein, partial [Flavobacteriaceae bacterium]|nr:PAS domain-containing protein [Flavobacteriaceae bacterium]